jgi:hypothetical protein
MTCSEVQEVLPELLDVPVEGRYPAEFQSHLRDCADCSELISDLKSISGEARHLAATDEPSPLLWLRIAAQLRSEGVIRDQQSEFAGHELYRPSLNPNPQPWWKLSWVVPVAAVVLVAGTYVMKHQSAPVVAERNSVSSPAPKQNPAPVPGPEGPAATASDASEVTAGNTVSSPRVSTRDNTARLAQDRTRMEESAPSPADEQFLSVVSSHAPAMKTTYEKQLQVVNADIRETQAYVDQNPGDADARQHLMDAYQQKALLYQIGLDRIQ